MQAWKLQRGCCCHCPRRLHMPLGHCCVLHSQIKPMCNEVRLHMLIISMSTGIINQQQRVTKTWPDRAECCLLSALLVSRKIQRTIAESIGTHLSHNLVRHACPTRRALCSYQHCSTLPCACSTIPETNIAPFGTHLLTCLPANCACAPCLPLQLL